MRDITKGALGLFIAAVCFWFGLMMQQRRMMLDDRIVIQVPESDEYRYALEKVEGKVQERMPEAAAIIEVKEQGKLISYVWRRVLKEAQEKGSPNH